MRLKIQSDSALNDVRSRVRVVGNRRTVTPLMRSVPSGYSFFQVVYSRAHVVSTSTWWREAIRSAMSRQWYSEPPRISVPYRWMMNAIFTKSSCGPAQTKGASRASRWACKRASLKASSRAY
jgi:hypothetical protein